MRSCTTRRAPSSGVTTASRARGGVQQASLPRTQPLSSTGTAWHMLCGPWPAYYMSVALGPCNETRPPRAMPAQGRHKTTLPKERGCPEQCQLRGNRTGLRKILAAGAELKPIRQWKAGATKLAAGAELKPIRQWKIERARIPAARELLLTTPPRRAPRCASSGARRYHSCTAVGHCLLNAQTKGIFINLKCTRWPQCLAKVVSTSASARGAVSARPVARLRPRRAR